MSTRSIFYHRNEDTGVTIHIYDEAAIGVRDDIRLEIEFPQGVVNVPCPMDVLAVSYHQNRRRSRRQSFNLPLPSGESNLQHAIYEVIRRLAANQISTPQAGLILNALHNITRNSPPTPPTTSSPKPRLP